MINQLKAEIERRTGLPPAVVDQVVTALGEVLAERYPQYAAMIGPMLGIPMPGATTPGTTPTNPGLGTIPVPPGMATPPTTPGTAPAPGTPPAPGGTGLPDLTGLENELNRFLGGSGTSSGGGQGTGSSGTGG